MFCVLPETDPAEHAEVLVGENAHSYFSGAVPPVAAEWSTKDCPGSIMGEPGVIGLATSGPLTPTGSQPEPTETEPAEELSATS
jgi:hypothetical protein